MAFRIALLDAVTNKFKSSNVDISTLALSYVDESFTVGGGGQSNFVVAQVFSAPSKIDVFRNGIKEAEGPSNSWQRNVGLNRIEFTYTVPEFALVIVRVYL
jgi:hypothetical protein